MRYVTTSDEAQIFYKDWGAGRAVVLSHGWPLNADSWDAQALVLASNGYRVVAHDRRGHGRSTQTWGGNEMDTYADDLAVLLDTLDLRDVTLVGFSTGGGEVARYIGRHGTSRVAQLVLVSAVPPYMLKTDDNPGGVPIDVFDGIRAGSLADRSQLYRDLADTSFFGNNVQIKLSLPGLHVLHAHVQLGRRLSQSTLVCQIVPITLQESFERARRDGWSGSRNHVQGRQVAQQWLQCPAGALIDVAGRAAFSEVALHRCRRQRRRVKTLPGQPASQVRHQPHMSGGRQRRVTQPAQLGPEPLGVPVQRDTHPGRTRIRCHDLLLSVAGRRGSVDQVSRLCRPPGRETPAA